MRLVTRALFALVATSLMIGAHMTSAYAQSASAVHVVRYLAIAPESVAKAKPLLRLHRDAALAQFVLPMPHVAATMR